MDGLRADLDQDEVREFLDEARMKTDTLTERIQGLEKEIKAKRNALNYWRKRRNALARRLWEFQSKGE